MFDLSSMIYRIPALLFAIAIHEYAHAATADALGDHSQRYSGRMTLNPLAHLDPMGALMLVLFGFGWAKPVEVNSRYFKDMQKDMLKVSLAGPAANLFLCFLALFVLALLRKLGVLSTGVYTLLAVMAQMNVWFAFFNLLPIPPLDGSRIITVLLPAKQAWDFENFAGRYGMYILLALVFTGVTSAIIVPLANIYLSLCNLILGLVF